jgi:uncharacterized membrane protein YeaQ/YmgE (transglycosylase-associated protein family)
MLTFTAWIVIGVLVGAMARRLSGKRGSGPTATFVVALTGSAVFGFLTHCIVQMKRDEPLLLDLWSVALAAFGACFALAGYRLAFRRGRSNFAQRSEGTLRRSRVRAPSRN